MPGAGTASADSSPRDVAASAALLPRARAAQTISSFSAMIFGSDSGRPYTVPAFRDAARPALTRSIIHSRSYSASVPSMFTIRRPVVVAGSIPSEIDCTAMFFSRSSSTVARTSSMERPSRSIRHTTMVSPGRTNPSRRCIPGRVRASFVPETTSE